METPALSVSSALSCESPSESGLNKGIALVMLAAALAGCQSGKFTYYISPRVTGRVLAADTRQPLANAIVRRVEPEPYAGADTRPKGGQLQMQPAGARTDADGRFVLDARRDPTMLHLFRRGDWYSVTVSCERSGYGSFQTNYSGAGFTERSAAACRWSAPVTYCSNPNPSEQDPKNRPGRPHKQPGHSTCSIMARPPAGSETPPGT
jgi:hypothetical protein